MLIFVYGHAEDCRLHSSQCLTFQGEGLKTRTRAEFGKLVSFTALVSCRPSGLQTVGRSAILSGAATTGSHRGPGDERS